MNWRGAVAAVATGLALVVGSVVTVADGHDGTPAVAVLDAQPSGAVAALPLSASFGSCVLANSSARCGGGAPGRGLHRDPLG